MCDMTREAEIPRHTRYAQAGNMLNQLRLETSVGECLERLNCHMKHAQAGSVPNCPISAETSRCGHAHAFNIFLVQTVHLVVDSGELVQPDVTLGLEGMARRPAYTCLCGQLEISCW